MLPLLRIANALITTMASGQPSLPLLYQNTTQLVPNDRAQPIDERLRFPIRRGGLWHHYVCDPKSLQLP
jgi:hypothetical protein